MLKHNELTELHGKIRRYLLRFSGVGVAKIELDLRKIAQSHLDAIERLNYYEKIINSIIDLLPEETLDEALKKTRKTGP